MKISIPFLTKNFRKVYFLLPAVLLAVMASIGFSPQEKEAERPNFVFIISDQHKLDATGAYGSTTAITPNIDELASNGIRFNNFYTPAPVCAPARAALMTGMDPYANRAIYHKAPIIMPNGNVKHFGSGILRQTGYTKGITTMAEALQANGYATASPGKMHVHGELQVGVDKACPEGNDMGFDEISVRYYTNFPGGHYEDEVGTDTYQRYRQFKKYKDAYPKGPMNLNEDYQPTLVKNDEDNFDMVVARKSVEFINTCADEDRNFFLHVGFEKPHAPFTTTRKYLDMHNPKDYDLPSTFNTWYGKGKYPWVPNWVHSGIPKDPGKAQNVMAAYNACITEMDDMVGRVIQALKDKGVYENTVIIYTTDHGEHLFEHGLRGKHCMYEDAVNIPFIISYPKLFQSNTTNNSLASLIDIFPTFCEMAGIAVPEEVQGRSLVEALKNGTEVEGRKFVFSEFRGADYKLIPGVKNVPSRMIRFDDYKFVYTHGIIHQLYDLKNDPDELDNLIFDEKYQSLAEELYFLTMAEWRFQEYEPLKASVKQGMLKWQDFEQVQDYTLFYAKEDDPTQAKAMAHGLTSNSYELSEEGYYWVLAHPKLTKTSPRFGELPVALAEYSYQLPISDPVKF